MAPGHGICVCLFCPTPAPGGAPGHPGFGADMPTPATAPPPVQVCIKHGDRYTPVDTARVDLADHRATLTPGGTPLDIATPMVTKATFDKARGGLVLVPSAGVRRGKATPGSSSLPALWGLKFWEHGPKPCVTG